MPDFKKRIKDHCFEDLQSKECHLPPINLRKRNKCPATADTQKACLEDNSLKQNHKSLL
ncbi:hypothetical protein G4228_010993 [Cervus hanglu yarkandensis]|nr:hypothetical protein G4228_010993 [Cervus hanglu yarkandensis]